MQSQTRTSVNMFGSFRLVLAVMVVITHIGGVEVVAGIAVWGFFMLSGYLMTATLQRKYGFTRQGLLAFSASRALRLLPAYWLSVIITLIVISTGVGPTFATAINGALAAPHTAREYFSNTFILGHTTFGLGRIERALSPSAWAVDVEILMYACSGIFLAKYGRAPRFSTTVLLGLFPFLWLGAKSLMSRGHSELANQLTYSFLPAALLPYALGAWVYQRREWLQMQFRQPWLLLMAGGAGMLVCALLLSRLSVTAAYVLSLPCSAAALIALSRWKKTGRVETIDSFLGLMSYPVYLLHWTCALFTVKIFGATPMLMGSTTDHIRFNRMGFVIVLLVTLLSAALITAIVERPLERWRQKVVSRKLASLK